MIGAVTFKILNLKKRNSYNMYLRVENLAYGDTKYSLIDSKKFW